MKPRVTRFECTACGACCSGSGVVPVHPDDVRALASYLGLDVETFAGKYLDYILQRFIFTDGVVEYPMLELKQVATSCVFLVGKLCGVHEAKPFVCKNGPFVLGIIGTRGFWKDFKRQCPGFGSGPAVQVAQIRELLTYETARDKQYLRELESHDDSLEKVLGVRLPARQLREVSIPLTYKEYLRGSYRPIARLESSAIRAEH